MELQQFEQIGTFRTYPLHGKLLVLNTKVHNRITYNNANFMGTGCALAGRLRKNESLSEWVSLTQKKRQK